MQQHEERDVFDVAWFVGKRAAAVLLGLVLISMAGCPLYNVWSSKMEGEAILAHAHAARMVAVTQAQAELEAASKRAEAIKIVGQAAQDFPEYRQQEFIGAFAEAMHNGKISQIIYVPTEANIPIIEVRRPHPEKAEK